MRKKSYKRKKRGYKRKNTDSFFFDSKRISGFLTGILFTLIITSLPNYLHFDGFVEYYKEFFSPVALAAYNKPIMKEIGSPLVVDGENISKPHPFDEAHGQGAGGEGTSGQVVLHGSRETKKIALTFDADMTPGMEYNLQSGQVNSYYDNRIVAILGQTQTKATVFLTGMWIETYPAVTKQLAADPLFELANHSYSHPSFSGDCYGLPQVPASQYPEEVEKTQQLLRSVAGVENNYFRFPGGCYSQDNLAMIKKLGLTVVHWDVVSEDGFNDNTEMIENNVLNNVQNGSIIIMHFNGPPNEPSTADALQVVIPILKAKGFQFVKVSDLLNPQEAAVVDIKKYLLSLDGV